MASLPIPIPLNSGQIPPPSPPTMPRPTFPCLARQEPACCGFHVMQFLVCFNWVVASFGVWPHDRLVHSSPAWQVVRERCAFLVVAVVPCAWMCRAGWEPGSRAGPGCWWRTLGSTHRPGLVTPRTSTTGRLQSFKPWSCLSQATPCFRR